jgi:hypothetical protein
LKNDSEFRNSQNADATVFPKNCSSNQRADSGVVTFEQSKVWMQQDFGVQTPCKVNDANINLDENFVIFVSRKSKNMYKKRPS